MRRTSHLLPCVRSGTPGHKPCRYFRPVCPCSRRPPSSPIGSSSVRGVGYGEIRASARRSGPVNSHRVYVRPLMDLLQASAFFSSDGSHQPVELNVKSCENFTWSGWGSFKISAPMITTELTTAEKHAWYISMAGRKTLHRRARLCRSRFTHDFDGGSVSEWRSCATNRTIYHPRSVWRLSTDNVAQPDCRKKW